MENSTPVKSPGSLREKEEKGDQIEEKDMVDQEESTTSVSILDRGLKSDFERERVERHRQRQRERQRQRQIERQIQIQWERYIQILRDIVERERYSQILRETVERLRQNRQSEKIDIQREIQIQIQREIQIQIQREIQIQIRMEILKEIKNEVENQEINDISAARMQEMKLLKHYGLLQEELNWPDIISIADDLYSDGHLQWHELKKIKDRSLPRRKAIDILLRVVLGNASSVSVFIKIMKSKSRVSCIAEIINMTQISVKEMERFHIIEGNPQGQIQSTYQGQSCKFQLSEAIHCLHEKEEVIDQISDSLLSTFHISISDHTRILEQANVDEKIHELADLIKTCPDGVYDVFVGVLTKNNLKHVLESLDRNQMVNIKRKCSFDHDYPPAQKRTKIDHNHQGSASEAVKKIASGLRVDTVRQKVAKASKDLGLEFKEAFGGSLGLSIAFKLASPHKRLRQPFA